MPITKRPTVASIAHISDMGDTPGTSDAHKRLPMVARFLTAIEGGFIGGLGSGGGAHANARKRSNGTWIMKKAGGVPGNFANRMGVT